MSQIQPVADGPAGPDRTRHPVGTDRIQLVNDGDRPMAAGPVGPVFHSDPLGPSRMPSLDDLHQPLTVDPWDTDGIYAVNASDWPTAGGPVDRLLGLDPLGPSGMSLLDGYNQPPAVGPVSNPSRPGPGDHPESIADCGQTIQLRGESEGTNEVPVPVNQTGSDVRKHCMKIGTADGQTDPCDTPPSSDSGVHSLEEQWEKMSTDSLVTTSEQTQGGPEQLDSDTSGRMEAETTVGIENVGMDYTWRQEPVVRSHSRKQPEDGDVGVKMWTTHECEGDTVCSGDRIPDIADLADFSDNDSEASVEFQPGPWTKGNCDGLVENTSKLCNKQSEKMVTFCTDKNDIMNSVSDEWDSDIAHMSDFSDEEVGSQEESRPGTLPGCAKEIPGDETLYWCDRPVATTVTLKLCDKPVDNLETMVVDNNDIMNSVSEKGDLDIANMSDFL